jgi:cystathionine beta-lyase/cystathionine gamma-synthase
LRPTTAPQFLQVFYVEVMSNPLLEVPDLRGVAAFCKRHGLTSIIDSTFLPPTNFRALQHGFNVVVHRWGGGLAGWG